MRKYCTYYIKQIHDYVEKRANNELRKNDLTLALATVLILLSSDSEKQLALKAIEHELGVAQSTTVGIVGRLEQKGFVRKLDSPDDKRVKVVQITQEGLASCSNIAVDMDEGVEFLLQGLTEEERTILDQLLQRVCKNLE